MWRQHASSHAGKCQALQALHSWTELTKGQEHVQSLVTLTTPMGGGILPAENHSFSSNCPHNDKLPMEARLILQRAFG